MAEVKRTHGGHHVMIGFDGAIGDATRIFGDKRLVAKYDGSDQYAELELAAGADAQEILRSLVSSGARLSRFEIAEPSLNKIFIDLVGPEAATAAAQSNGGEGA
jgi:ABC-2 type transport system ATP-binding protein